MITKQRLNLWKKRYNTWKITTKQRFNLWKKRFATRDNLWRVLIVMAMVVFATGGLYLGWHFSDNELRASSPWVYSLANLGPELAGIVIGVIFIDALNERRQNKQLKAQLIRQMGSPIKDVAVPAARELAHHRWLFDGSLKGANLTGAHLKEAELRRAHLERALLSDAHLEEAKLTGAHLEGAMLPGARLENADLYEVHLERAELHGAHLEEAELQGAHLEGANLFGVHLEGAKHLTSQQLKDAKSVINATMPDGVKLKGQEGDPTLDEWLAKKPKCLNSGMGEIDATGMEEIMAMLADSNLEEEEQ